VAPDEDETMEQVLDLDYESNLPGHRREKLNGGGATTITRSHPSALPAGRPIDRQSALEVLVSGKQRQRSAAAVELALLSPEASFFEVRAAGGSQDRELAAWTS
jgi:hypothetical protein